MLFLPTVRASEVFPAEDTPGTTLMWAEAGAANPATSKRLVAMAIEDSNRFIAIPFNYLSTTCRVCTLLTVERNQKKLKLACLG